MKPRLLLLLVALLFLHACEFGTAPGGGGTGGEGLTGILVDSRGERLVGARVRVYPAPGAALAKAAGALAIKAESTLTGADGAFRFRHLANGRYNLEASFQRGDTTLAFFLPGIDFKSPMNLGADTLRAAGSLSVKILGATGSPLAGISCSISGSSWQAVSGAEGTCTFTGVAPGDYRVSVTVQNVTVVSDSILISSGQVSEGGTVRFSSTGQGEFIPATWILTSLQGYVFQRPADLELQYEGYGDDSWDAVFHSPSLTLQMGSGVTGPLDRPDSFPEYAESVRILDSSDGSIYRAVLITYRVPESQQVYFGAEFITGLQVYHQNIDVVLPAMLFRIVSGTRQGQTEAVRILKTVFLWKGPGTAPVPAPLKPALLNPAPNAAELSLSPLLSWRNQVGSTLTTHYRLQVATDPAFLFKVTDDSVQRGDMFTDTLRKTVPLPSYNTRYYWRVVAVGPGGSTESEVRTFTTAVVTTTTVPPIVPPLQSPAAYATGVSVTPTFTWTYATGVSTTQYYRVQVSADSLFGSLIFNDSVKAVPTPMGLTSRTLTTALTTGGRYFWRVIGVGPGGSTASETRGFETTPTGYGAPLMYPLAGATGIEWSPALSWSPYYAKSASTSFRVQVSLDSLFTTFVVNDSLAKEPPFTGQNGPGITVGPLSPATRYYWRVITFGGVGATYSGTRAFTTHATTSDTVPIVPQLGSPSEGAVVFSNSDSASFVWTSWNGVATTTYYHLQVATDNSFLDPVINDTLKAQNRETGLTGRKVALERGKDYYWRVVGVGRGGFTPSATATMTLSVFPPD